MASASFVSSACNISSACTTDVDFTIPSVTASQLILVGLTVRNNASPIITAPTGFTSLLSACQGATIFSRVYYRVATGAENSTCTFDFSASTRAAVITSIWDNINTACPFDVSAAASSAGNSACCQFPTLTVTIASAALVYFTGTASNPAITNDAALTEREEITTLGGNRCQSWQGDELKAASGATTARVNTLEAAQVNTTFSIALSTASAAGGGGVEGTGTASSVGIPGINVQAQFSGSGGAWTSILTDVLSGPGINARYGISGNGPTDRVAGTGTMNFSLDNSSRNSGASQGYYSPGHANARTGFEQGAGVRLQFQYSGSTFTKFSGRIDSIAPVLGVYRNRATNVQAVDWIDEAAKHKLRYIDMQIATLSGSVVSAVVADMARPPSASTIGVGQSEWPYALDTAFESTTALAEFQRIAQSDMGYIFIRGNTASGNEFVFQEFRYRLSPSSIATLSNDMVDMAAPRTRQKTYTRVKATAHPRAVDAAATTVLYSLFSYPTINPGATFVIEGNYTDPSLRAQRVGGLITAPIANEDYTFGTGASGQELTGDITLNASFGAYATKFSIPNSGSQTGYLGLQLRGQGIYDYSPTDVVVEDVTLAASYGKNDLTFDMPYEPRTQVASAMADYELFKWKRPNYSIDAVTFVCNGSNTLVLAGLQTEPGDLITLTEGMSGVSASQYFVHSVGITVSAPNVVRFTWGLVKRFDTTDYWTLNVDKLGVTQGVDSGSQYAILGP